MRTEGVSATRRHLVTRLAIVVAVFLVMGLAAVAGPNWLGNVLIPVVVILGVVFVCLSLLVWVVNRLPNPPYRDWRQ